MAGGRCTVRFFLYDKVKPHPKGFPIYARITFQRKKARFATGEYCKRDNWDDDNGRPIRAVAVREHLLHLESRVYQIKRELERDEKVVSATIIRDILKGKDKSKKPKLLQYIDAYIERISRLTSDYTSGTVSHYKTMRKHLHNFLKLHQLEEMLITQVDLEFVKNLDEFFLTTPTVQFNRPMGRNTANKYHTKFKTVLLDAVQKDIIPKNPYTNFRLKDKKVNRTFLTIEELERLRALDFSENDSLAKTRDIFLWSCYTGLRFMDAQNLTHGNIQKDNKGQYWLSLEQQKTKELLSIPLTDKAVEIYDKYASLRAITGQILPRLVNQKVNAYLKVMADLAGIKKKLTHHVARHTFATTVMLDNDIPLEVVQSFLGHQSIKTTQIYAKITREKKLGVIQKLNQKL